MGVRKAVLDKELFAADPEDHKSSVRCVTTSALAAYTRTGNVITASGNGALAAQDGITLAVDESLLVTTGASAVDNGIYVVTQVGDGSHPFILTRRGDADLDQYVNSGMRCGIEEGTQFGERGIEFVLVTPNPIILNTTALDFQEAEAAGGGGGVLASVDSPDVAIIPEGMRSPIVGSLGGTGAVGGPGVLGQIVTDKNHTIMHLPIRSRHRIPARQQMLYKGIPRIDGILIADGMLVDASPSAAELLATLGQVVALDEFLVGGGSPMQAKTAAEVRGILDVPTVGDLVGVSAIATRNAEFWNASSNDDGSFSGSDANNGAPFVAEYSRINKWIGGINSIVATLPVGGPADHNKLVSFFEATSDGAYQLQIAGDGGQTILIPGVGTGGVASISVSGDSSYVVLKFNYSTGQYVLIHGFEYLSYNGWFVSAMINGTRSSLSGDPNTVLMHPRSEFGYDLGFYGPGFLMGQIFDPQHVTHLTAIVGTINDVIASDDGVQNWRESWAVRLEAAAPASITGFSYSFASDPDFCPFKIVRNGGAATITLKHADGGSAAGNQIRCPGAVDYALLAETSVLLIREPNSLAPNGGPLGPALDTWLVIPLG